MKIALFTFKIAISGLLAWLLLSRVDFTPVSHFLKSAQALGALALCVVIFTGQAVLAAIRLRWIMRLMGVQLPVYVGFSTWMIGLLVSQTLVTFIAGDAARIWQLARRGYGRRISGSAIFLERALGFAVLMAMVLVCVPFLLSHGASGATGVGLLIITILCVVGIICFAASAFISGLTTRFAPRLHDVRIAKAIVDVASAARHLARDWKLSTNIVLISVVMHLCNVAAFFILGKAAQVDLDIVVTTAIALPVMLIALMPIALAGWGLREGAAVVGYGLFNVQPESALAISVAFGLALLIGSLPGGFYLWVSRSISDQAGTENDGRSLPV